MRKLTCSLNRPQIQLLDLFPCPRSLSQELQTGLDARIICKAFDGDAPAQFLPAVLLHKLGKDHFERNAMQGIFGLFVWHEVGNLLLAHEFLNRWAR